MEQDRPLRPSWSSQIIGFDRQLMELEEGAFRVTFSTAGGDIS